MVGMIAFAIITMIPIFKKEEYELDRTSQYLNMYYDIGGGKFRDSADPLNYTLTVNSALDLLNNTEYRIYGNLTAYP